MVLTESKKRIKNIKETTVRRHEDRQLVNYKKKIHIAYWMRFGFYGISSHRIKYRIDIHIITHDLVARMILTFNRNYNSSFL